MLQLQNLNECANNENERINFSGRPGFFYLAENLRCSERRSPGRHIAFTSGGKT
jgi:hypothetical protein